MHIEQVFIVLDDILCNRGDKGSDLFNSDIIKETFTIAFCDVPCIYWNWWSKNPQGYPIEYIFSDQNKVRCVDSNKYFALRQGTSS